jgi:hypothetical protein
MPVQTIIIILINFAYPKMSFLPKKIKATLKRLKRFPWSRFYLPLFFFGLIFLVTGVRLFWNDYVQRTDWIDYPAKINLSEVQRYRDSYGIVYYRAFIEYRYDIEGKEIIGVYYSIGDPHPDYAQKLVDKYPIGSTVSIKVNPNNEIVSVLIEKESKLGYLFLIVSALILFVSIKGVLLQLSKN